MSGGRALREISFSRPAAPLRGYVHGYCGYARNYVARDLEGHLWSFGTYMPRRRRPDPGRRRPR